MNNLPSDWSDDKSSKAETSGVDNVDDGHLMHCLNLFIQQIQLNSSKY